MGIVEWLGESRVAGAGGGVGELGVGDGYGWEKDGVGEMGEEELVERSSMRGSKDRLRLIRE